MAIKGGDPILEKQNWAAWFFGLCAFLFLSYGAAIYQEFVSRRTYIYYQAKFKAFDHDFTKQEFEKLKTSKAGDLQKAEQLKAAADEAKKKLESAEYEKLQKDHYDAYIDLGFVKAERSKVKSFQDAQFYNWKHALHTEGEESKHTKAEEKKYWVLDVELLGEASAAPEDVKSEVMKKDKFRSWDERLAEKQKVLDDVAAQIAKLEQEEKDARKAYEAANAPFSAYEERLAKIEERSIRNIDQIVNDRLGVGGAYTFGTVDRCRSCHVAIESGHEQSVFAKLEGELAEYKDYDKVFSVHPKRDPLFTKHPVDKVGCTVCHDGQGRANRIKTKWPGEDPDAYVFKVEMDQPHGPAKDHSSHQWEWPLLRGDYMQSNCQRCHAPQRWLDGAPVYEKGKGLFIDKGCAGCHAIKGSENLARVAPELKRIKSKVSGEWLVSWIENPKAFYPETRMPMFVFDEFQVGAKDPVENVKVMAHPERQSDTAMKIAAYLWQNSAPTESLPFGKFPGGGDAANGEKIVETVGCLGCHTIEKKAGDKTEHKGNHRAPPLYKAGAKIASADWIWNWVRNPRWHADTTTMPSLRLTESEARDVTAYLWAAGQAARPKADAALIAKLEDPANARAGNLLVSQWGCAGCHLIPGKEKDGRIGPELTSFGEKKASELAFGDSDIPEHELDSWYRWTRGKIHNPRQFVDVRSAARMPWFGLDKDEIEALTVFLRGQRNLRVPDDMKKQFVGRNATIERGRELVNRYGCVGCHPVEGRGGEILAFNKDRALQPPNLKAVGLKISSAFLTDFLKNPGERPIRPWTKIRMPTFPLTDEERADIVAYFRAVDGIDAPFDQPASQFDAKLVAQGEKDFSAFSCQQCHPWKGTRRESINLSNEGPELGNVWRRFRPGGLEAWLKSPGELMPGVNMPNFYFEHNARKQVYDPLYPPAAPTAEASEVGIDAMREFLMSQGGGKQISMNW